MLTSPALLSDFLSFSSVEGISTSTVSVSHALGGAIEQSLTSADAVVDVAGNGDDESKVKFRILLAVLV